ncbi:DUF4400 domain-containing protein [Citrobacter freundii]|nr:DUF4400 domain-containing protein [Citrobacter freundii]
MSEHRPSPPRSTPGPAGWLLSLTGRVIGRVLGALVLRIVLELVGLYFWWPQEGVAHVHRTMIQEQGALARDLYPHPLGDIALALLHYGLRGLLNLLEWSCSLFRHVLTEPIVTLISHTMADALISFMTRLLRLIATLPLFLLCAIAGVVEGVMLRDLRIFGTGNESVFIHRGVRWIGASVTTYLGLIYLAQPMLLPSTPVLIAAALWTGIILRMTASSFKRWW